MNEKEIIEQCHRLIDESGYALAPEYAGDLPRRVRHLIEKLQTLTGN